MPASSFLSLDNPADTDFTRAFYIMDIGIFAAVAMLVVWAVATVMFTAPGWVHLLLTFGVFLLVWRIVKLGERSSPARSGTDAP